MALAVKHIFFLNIVELCFIVYHFKQMTIMLIVKGLIYTSELHHFGILFGRILNSIGIAC